jgi:biopolymer transport protein ExbD
MFRKPSSRRKSHAGGFELNLVPILDTMVTLIGFLLFTTSFLALVHIESILPGAPAPDPNHPKEPQKPPTRLLQLTAMIRQNEVEILSPSQLVPAKKFPHIDAKMDLKGLREHLLSIKQQFPKEKTLVLMPEIQVPYDHLIQFMDHVRLFEATDSAIFVKNEQTGVDEQVKEFWSNLVFGNL